MTVKNAALLALVGTGLLLLVLLATLLRDTTGVMNGTVPAIALLTSLIRTFAAVTVFVFFWVFHKS
jgi:hypothetical protein